ncbi:PAS domain-containing sensor histidine kinase [Rhodopseudomonas sp. HC1]|uniref:PAS domain-containing sensor histidine kinase n=1 Tax=Rhodopseudomonas infernalis TaxID=2897386 RepID=UPI001EE8D7C5|nr:PAS domain-containing sensor histidine kinase [Rhodopseudomonas infernalis]MCG6203204.1 PAS domain-containing sensor histidine kinase [Rhodopseudomonas infernalis]
MAISKIISECLDALLHPSARFDALASARHRAFIAPRLLGSLAALAAFPVYLVLRGAPSALEALAFVWLIAPILLSWFLSRTGRYESAHVLSSLSLASLVMVIAALTGGIESFAAIWLVLVPLEAALSASRRVVGFATALALGCATVLIAAGHFGLLPAPAVADVSHGVVMAISVAAATLYAAGLAFGAESLARTSDTLLSVEEERYRLLARHMSDVISRHARSGDVQFISPAVEALIGQPAQRLLGHGLFDRVHVADRPAYLKALSDAARGEAGSVEFRIRRDVPRDDRGRPIASEFIWLEMRCRPFEAGEAASPRDNDVVAVMRDVTDRKLQEQALEQARADADRADAAKSRFLATMSHELRTPLNAIIGFSDMILHEDELMLAPERRKEYAQLINDSGQHLLSVVNGILDMSKMESGNFEIAPEPFAPRPALLNCCNLLALKARENGIDLVTRAPENLPEIVGDPRAFKQILLNLVSNAIKFTERGGAVSVEAVVEGARLVLRVSDTGVGIAAEDLKRIGDPFFQAGTIYQRRHEGTGLGLSIVKSLVGLHGGTIDVTSEVDRGTTVTVSLPLAQPMRSNVTTLAPVLPAEPKLQDYQVKKSA